MSQAARRRVRQIVDHLHALAALPLIPNRTPEAATSVAPPRG
jgi:hypothetical protein